MKYVEFDQTRPMDLILLGRVAIDFNPAYNDQVKEEFKPLKDVHTFEKFRRWISGEHCSRCYKTRIKSRIPWKSIR